MIWLEAHFTIMLVVALTLAAATLVLQQRRPPQSTAAWLFFLVALPYVALPIFLALGFRKKGARFAPVRFAPTDSDADPTPEIEQVFVRYGLPPATSGNTFHLMTNGPDAWTKTLAILQSAQHTLDVTYYRIENDAYGRAFVDALTARAQAGVRVRLIIDRLGGFFRPAGALRAFVRAGGELRDFAPILSGPRLSHLNLRNHRKMILADDARILSGGRNIGADYYASDGTWVDLGFTLEGPAAARFAELFCSDWAATGGNGDMASDQIPAAQGTLVAQLVPSGPDMKDDAMHDGLVHAMHRANRRIWIATPYFLPTEHIEHALTTAARRGIDVRILLPARSNQRIADIARGGYLRSLSAAGCAVLQHGAGMMHAKTVLVDDIACIGTANCDVRSMLLNFELMLFVYDPAAVAQIEDWFEQLFPGCTTGIPPANLPRRLVEGVFRMGAPIL